MNQNIIILFWLFIGIVILVIAIGFILSYHRKSDDFKDNKKEITDLEEEPKFPFPFLHFEMSKGKVDDIIGIKGFLVEETQINKNDIIVKKEVYVYNIDQYLYDDIDEDFISDFSIYGFEITFEDNKLVSKKIIYEAD